jgi:MYXO-CTERM domain-containing protein
MRALYLVILAGAAIWAMPSAAQADIAPPELNGCSQRPLGAVCYVKGMERGVCARRPGGEGATCLVIPNPKDAPPPSTAPDPPTSLPQDSAESPSDSPTQRSSCAVGAGAPGKGAESAAMAALIALAGARRWRRRGERP